MQNFRGIICTFDLTELLPPNQTKFPKACHLAGYVRFLKFKTLPLKMMKQGVIPLVGSQNFHKLTSNISHSPPPPPPNTHTYMCVSGQRHILSSRRKYTGMVAQTMCPN